MELVIDKVMFGEFINLISPKPKSEKENLLMSSLQDERNKIKISSKYLEYIENYILTVHPDKIDLFNSFITQSVDNNQIISFKSTNNFEDENKELEYCYNYEPSRYTFLITKNEIFTDSVVLSVAVFDNISKPNKDWLILSLCSRQIVNVNYSHFSSQNGIINFFNCISTLSKSNEYIFITDRYFNVSSQSILNCFKGKKEKYKCYTTFKDQNDKNYKRNSIKSFFGKRKTSVLFSTDKRITHSRQILIKNLLVETTHDFSEIHLKNKNWNIYISIDDEKKVLFLANTSSYN
jgi:hypothetical protein